MSIVHIVCTGNGDLSLLQALPTSVVKVVFQVPMPSQDTLELYSRARSLLQKKAVELNEKVAELSQNQDATRMSALDPRVTANDHDILVATWNNNQQVKESADIGFFSVLLNAFEIATFDYDTALAAKLAAAVSDVDNYGLQYGPVLFVSDEIRSVFPTTVGVACALNIVRDIDNHPMDIGTAYDLRDFISEVDADLTRSCINAENGLRPTGLLADEFFSKAKGKTSTKGAGGKRK